MPLHYKNLDDVTRRHMREEFDGDVANGRLYISARLSPTGRQEYPDLLREAIEQHDDACRGLCARVSASGPGEVEVYRGQQSARPRQESEALIGRRLEAQTVLRDLRSSVGVEPALGVPPGPTSGLALRLPA